MKKTICVFLSCILCVFALPFADVSATSTTFNGQNVEVGDVVTYTYYLTTPMKVVNSDFIINYTGETLSLVSAASKDRFPIINNGGMFNDSKENQIIATCSNIGSMYDFTNGGFLFIVSFNVIGEGASTADVNIKFLNGVNPQGIAYSEIPLIKNSAVVYEGVSVSENSLIASSCEHNYTSVVTKEATCTENGVLTKTCTLCGKTLTESIAATGHKFGSWITTTQPTQTAQGEQTRTCSVCTTKETKVIPALSDDTSQIVLGDSDGNGKLENNDVTLIQKYLARIISSASIHTDRSDFNKDEIINIKDATAIQKKIVGLL